MGESSSIQWTDATWNPFHGCKKVSTGCKYCYMYRDKERYGKDATQVLKSKTKFNEPLKWTEPKLIFTCSWSDWFIEEADQWRDELWQIIKNTPQHTYQILTKRPENISDRLPADWGTGYPNVWLGISAENQETYNERMEHFALVPAKVKFISAEPLLEEIHFPAFRSWYEEIDWVIIGGESGNNIGKYLYRECKQEWMERMVKQCYYDGVRVFVKQTGTYIAKQNKYKDRHGGDIKEWPSSLQFREFPRHPAILISNNE